MFHEVATAAHHPLNAAVRNVSELDNVTTPSMSNVALRHAGGGRCAFQFSLSIQDPKTWGTTENRVRDFRDRGGPFAAHMQSQGAANPGAIGVSPGNVEGISRHARTG